jgi:phosphoribosylaminoimidazole-succinocarboxamide synthase
MANVVLRTEIPGTPVKHGKVRDVYDLGDALLIAASDRISAFDVIMKTGIPCKGQVLTQISKFWFEFLGDTVENHLIADAVADFPKPFCDYPDQLAGRSMLVKKTRVLPVECIVRGYITGPGWKEYQQQGTVCGIELPKGLKQCEKLPEPIFTPSTKAELGAHDENIDFAECANIIGRDKAGRIIFIDEVLTPDSSRFWPADKYHPGRDQESFDKQFVRNYLEDINFNKSGPGVELPADITDKTSAKYIEAYERLTGGAFKPAV